MIVDERSRHELYRRLVEALGPEAATTLIEHLPPVGWADVATKHDLSNIEKRMDLRFDHVDERLSSTAADLRAAFEHELRTQTTTVLFGLVSVVLTMAALAFALARFT